jgi:uncharacterized surface protein with fasciclin (FAS1) repeats
MLNGEILNVARTTAVTVTTTRTSNRYCYHADVEGSNGVVHIIDGVLVPPPSAMPQLLISM